MSKRYLSTFVSLLVVLGLQMAYSTLSAQFLSREQLVRHERQILEPSTTQATGPRVSHEAALKHLPDAPWAVGSRVKIHSDGLHIFFNERAQESSNTEIRVSPVAMVWGGRLDEQKPGEEPKEPVVILAESAIFQFDQPVELSEIRTHLIRQIVLSGQVMIRGENDLRIVGRNFTFARASQHLFSEHPLQFRMQEHRGFARNIQLNLDMLDGGAHADNPRVQGIREVVIRDHLELHLQPENQPPALITCEDRFQYRLEEQQAMLMGDVFLHRTDEEGLVDELSCDLLTLQFAEELKEGAVATADKTASQPANGVTESDSANDQPSMAGFDLKSNTLSLVSLRAEGERVDIRSEKSDLRALGQQIDYNLQQRVLKVRHKKAVQVRYQGADLITPSLEVRLDEQDQPIFARCAGPGQLRYLDKEAPQDAGNQALLAEAQWRDALVMEPDPSAGPEHQRVTLSGLARLSSPRHKAGLIAQTLQIWVDQSAAAKDKPSTLGGTASIPAGVRVKKAKAEGEVAVASPQLEGVYESLTLHFERDSTGLIKAAEAGQPQAQPQAGAPAEEPSGIQLASAEADTAKPRMEIDARDLTLRVVHDEEFKKLHLAHVESEGELKATGHLPDEQDAIVVCGRGAEIFNDGQDQQRFRLLGTQDRFAWVQNGQVRIDGIDLFVDRTANHARVHGGGMLQFPVDTNFEGLPLGESKLMQVSWREQMKFNGKQAHFLGRVRAKIGDSVIQCEELIVTLDQTISLQKPDKSVHPKLAQIECRDRVRLEMNHYEESKLIGVRYVDVASFVINQVSGDMRAQGPGKMEFWQRRTGDSKLGLPEATMSQGPDSKGKPKSEKPPEGWDYTQLTFAGEMVGNIHKRLATLKDRVNILHGPVDHPLVSFERDDRPPNSVRIYCEQLELLVKNAAKSTGEDKQPWAFEVQAQNNAEIEGDQFFARADLVTYDHESKLVVMRALENRHATLWYYETPHSPRSRYDVKMARLSPNGNILELDRTRGASASQ